MEITKASPPPPYHLLSAVLQFILQKPWGFSNNSAEGKAKVSLGLNSSEILFLTNEAYYSAHIPCYTEYVLLLQLSTSEDLNLHSASMFSYVRLVCCNHFQNSGISSASKVVQRRASKPHDVCVLHLNCAFHFQNSKISKIQISKNLLTDTAQFIHGDYSI